MAEWKKRILEKKRGMLTAMLQGNIDSSISAERVDDTESYTSIIDDNKISCSIQAK